MEKAVADRQEGDNRLPTVVSSNLAGKRPLDADAPQSESRRQWFGAAGDGGRAGPSRPADAVKKSETAAVVSSLKSKLSKPKDGTSGAASKPSISKTGLTEAERLREQERHRAKAEATGKPVPYYRKS